MLIEATSSSRFFWKVATSTVPATTKCVQCLWGISDRCPIIRSIIAAWWKWIQNIIWFLLYSDEMERAGRFGTRWDSSEKTWEMQLRQQHIFKVPQIPGWSRIPVGACSWHSRRRISTTSQHILHLLDQFAPSSLLQWPPHQKITWCNIQVTPLPHKKNGSWGTIRKEQHV